MTATQISPGRVFVSYASEDRERVRPLVDYLRHEGLDVYLAPGP